MPARSSSRKGNAPADAGTDAVTDEAGEIAYSLRRSARRTVGIAVHRDGSVHVRAPMRASRRAIREVVASRAAWIGKARGRLAALPPKPPPPAYAAGERHRFLGQDYRLVVSRGRADSVELVVGCLCVTSRAEPTPARVRTLLEEWYRAQAEVVFAERLAACLASMAGEAIPFPAIRIRRMSSRWGSCASASGRINLNLWLVRAPVECIDYVVVHELCHFRVKSHGPRFWRLVARHLPDYAARRARLDSEGG